MLAKSALVFLLPFMLGVSALPAKHSTTDGDSGSDSGSASGGSAPDLKGSCAPGGNFDLSKFTLQLPIGKAFSPTSVSADKLGSCKGYQDPQKQFFFTESSDGAMVMKVPGSPSKTGCVTTKNSKHCRTELRENGSWDPHASKNRLSATLLVPTADDSGHGTVIGQIHIDDSISSKPVAELFINKKGELTMGVEQTRDGGNEIVTPVGFVENAGTKSFSYVISYENNKLAVAINGGSPKTLSTYKLDGPKSYFKAGNYNQGNSASEVRFLALAVEH